MKKNTNIYKPQLPRPSSGVNSSRTQQQQQFGTGNFSQTANEAGSLMDGLEITGNKIRKGYQLPEKYQLTKPDLLKRSSQGERKNQQNQESQKIKPYNQMNLNEQLQDEYDFDNDEESKSQHQEFQHYQNLKSQAQNYSDIKKNSSNNEFEDFSGSEVQESYINYNKQMDRSDNNSNRGGGNEFQTYMQYKMVNPEVKQIYKNRDVLQQKQKQQQLYTQKKPQTLQNQDSDEEFKKQTSKPFNTSQTRIKSGRISQELQKDISGKGRLKQQELQGSQVSNVSSGSTYLSQAQTASKSHSQKPSQDIDGLETKTIQSQSSIQNIIKPNLKKKTNKQFKLNDLGREPTPQEEEQIIKEYNQNNENQTEINFNNWVVQTPAGDKKVNQLLGERKKKELQELSQYINDLKQQNLLPSNFDSMVQQNMYILEQDDLHDISNYEFQNINENDEMSQMEAKIGEQMVKEQWAKLDELNRMFEESKDDLSQISTEDLKKNLLFITEVNKKKNKVQKSKKIQEENKNDTENQNQNDKMEKAKLDKKQKKKQKLEQQYYIELNKRLAFLNDDEKMEQEMICNKLPQEAQDRLNSMLQDIETFNEEEAYKQMLEKKDNPYNSPEEMQKIQEEIENVRQGIVLDEQQENIDFNKGILDETILPKDKSLREEAENRILSDKLKEINEKLYKVAIEEKNQQSQQQPQKQQILGLCSKLKQHVEYTPGPLLSLRMAELDELKMKHEEALKKLENLKKQDSVLKEFEAIKNKINENLEKVRRGQIIEIKKQEKNMKSLQVLEELKRENQQLMNGAKQNTGKEDDIHEYTKLKQDVHQSHEIIQFKFQNIMQQENALMEKIEQWKKEMQIFDEFANKEENQPENDVEDSQKPFEQEDLEQLDKIIEQEILNKHPELQIQIENDDDDDDDEEQNQENDQLNNIQIEEKQQEIVDENQENFSDSLEN